MEHRTPKRQAREARSAEEAPTPLWDRYYRAMRQRMRFPRYYRKAENW